MISILRGLRMAGDIGDRSAISYIFFGVVDFICLLMAAESLNALQFSRAAMWLVAGIASVLIGYHWPRIRERLPFARTSKPRVVADSLNISTAETPVGLADLLIEYSHDDRDRSVPPRDRPLLLKNVTVGKNALNVRMKSIEVHDDKLVFRPDIITCIVGGGEVEVVPEWENLKGKARFKLNELPDFLSVFCNRDGRVDKASLDGLFDLARVKRIP